jgi:intracellular multiplication protein IcmK
MKIYTYKALFLTTLISSAHTFLFAQNNSGTQAIEQLKMFQNQMTNLPNSQQTSAAPVKQTSQTAPNSLERLKEQILKNKLDSDAKSSAPATPQSLQSGAGSSNTVGNIVQATPEYLAQQQQLQLQQQLSQQPNQNLQENVDEEKIIEDLAFEQVEKQIFPMSDKEIMKLRGKYQDIELAKTAVPTPPTPVATSQFVNLSPGSTPPVIRLSQGFVTSLVFLDSTGSPWPIQAYDLGDPTSFNIQWDKTSNTLMIQATKLYNYGNMAVRLDGLNTPVMLTLIPGQKEVDYRVDMRIQGMGPNAIMPVLGDGLPPSANRVLLHVLDGVPPAGSTRLTVSGGDARAWLFKNKMYIRTNLTILSPAWLATMTSADGMHAYEMQKSPVILVTWHGKVMQLKVEGL